MMDRINSAVLDKICSLSSIGRYVVYSEDELFEAFPEDAIRTDGELKKTLKWLLNAGYIDVKYSGGSLYCIAPLKKYVPEPIPEPIPVLQTEAPKEDKKKTGNVFTVLIGSFVGGALGSLLVSLVFALAGHA